MSLGEVLTKALSGTLMGMGTVFLILILISLVISFFKYAAKSRGDTEDNEPDDITVKSDEEDDVICAIMTAIIAAKKREGSAASEPAAAEGPEPVYIVKSVKRRR